MFNSELLLSICVPSHVHAFSGKHIDITEGFNSLNKYKWEFVLSVLVHINRTIQVKGEATQKNFTGCEQREMLDGFSFIVLHFTWPEPQQKGEGPRAWSPTPTKCNVVEISLTASYIIQTNVACHQHLVSPRSVSIIDLWLEVANTWFTCVIWFHIQKSGFDKLLLMEKNP